MGLWMGKKKSQGLKFSCKIQRRSSGTRMKERNRKGIDGRVIYKRPVNVSLLELLFKNKSASIRGTAVIRDVPRI